jgi:hypothetical protein
MAGSWDLGSLKICLKNSGHFCLRPKLFDNWLITIIGEIELKRRLMQNSVSGHFHSKIMIPDIIYFLEALRIPGIFSDLMKMAQRPANIMHVSTCLIMADLIQKKGVDKPA